MTKEATLAGDCFWGEKRIRGASQEVVKILNEFHTT
jgi:peptide methionine sulfoxide reductase MsrA